MKIAIFHNFMDNIGGAEIVTLILARELNADIYTTNIDKEKIKKMGFGKIIPRIYSIGKIPLNPPFRQQFALRKFRKLNLNKTKKKYDFFIISGDWAVSGAVNNKPNLWYTHSVAREIWDFSDFAKKTMVSPIKRPLVDLWIKYNQILFKKYIKHLNKIVCNSKNTQNRIKKYIKKDSRVIYPPIETSKYFSNKSENYWISVNRLLPTKRIEIQIKAFSKLPQENLIIVGCFEKANHFQEYINKIKKIQPKNVIIKSGVLDNELKNLYSKCKGLITTAINEDFGMTALEAMACGKPVIAPNDGGYKETMINNKTGILINDIDEKKLTQEIEKMSKELESPKIRLNYKEACQNQAKRFDTKIFIKKIKKEIRLIQTK